MLTKYIKKKKKQNIKLNLSTARVQYRQFLRFFFEKKTKNLIII